MNSLAVLASGMVTALGYNAPATLAALRAGVSGVEVTSWMDFESGKPLRGAKVNLPQWSVGVDKLADLVAPAIDECMQAVGEVAISQVPVLIGIAHRDRAHRALRLEDDLLAAVRARLERSLHPDSQLFPFDEAGSVQALVTAHRLILQGRSTFAVVAGVDSFLHQAMLDSYLERRRVITPGNSNGFFPGEAGSAVLVGKAGVHGRDELRILGVGLAQEEATIDSTKPLRAKALTDAVRQALRGAGVGFPDIGWRITDLTGEHYKFKEAAFTTGRLDTGPRSGPCELWHPSEYFGAVGAAVLPCLLAQAMHAGQQGYGPGPLALCHIGSDDGQRAALVVGLHHHTNGENK